MAHPLAQRIAALRRRARLALLLHGAACTVSTIVAAWLLLALADYVFRYDELGVRLLSTAAALIVVGWATYRFVLPVLRADLNDVFLARQIERRHPELRERLAAAVAFLSADDADPRAGSSALRREVISETMQDFVPLSTAGVVSWRPLVRPMLLAGLIVGAVAACFVTNRLASTIAVRRLALPWGSTAWPQTNHLKFLNPVQRLASGSRFHAQVVDADGAEIPGEVLLLVRSSPEAVPEPRTMLLQGGVYTAERERVTTDFSYRAVGGDDRSMPWVDVQVVDPPTLQEVRWTFRYPDYAAWRTFESGPRPSEALLQATPVPVGTLVEFRARASKPLREARLIVGSSNETIAAKLDADRLGFAFSVDGGNAWKPTRSESFRFEMIGDDGFSGGGDRRFDMVVEPDPAPWAKLDQPRGPPEDPRGDVFVTPDAEIDVRITCGDAFTVRPNVALRKVELRYARSDRSSEGDQTIDLHTGPMPLEPAELDAPTQFHDEETRTLAHHWELKPLELRPGTFVNVYAAATDYAGQTRQSESRRLRVVAPTEFLERFNERQRGLHAELQKLRERQADTTEKTAELAKQLEAPPQAEEKPAEKLTRALDAQRQIAASLGMERKRSPDDPQAAAKEGIRGRVERMLADLQQNKIDNREVTTQLKNIDERLQAVEEAKSTERASAGLAESLREDLADAARRKPAAEALERAQAAQRELTESLDAMLRNLAQWEDYGHFHEELSRIAGEQEKLTAETREHLQQRLTKKNEPAADARRRDELAGKQSALARQFESLRRQMNQAQGAEKQEALSQAVAAAERANPADAMRAAGEELRNDRVGQAPQKQQEALDKLKEVMRALSAQNVDELARLVAKMKEGEKELASLRQQQEGLKKKFRDAAKQPDEAKRKQELERLARQQRELQKRAEKLAAELKRLKAERSAGKTSKSGGKMAAAGEGAEQGDAGGAAEQAEAAEQDLSNAENELARERRQAEADLARELAAKLEDDLKAAMARQERVVAETQRYDAQNREKPLTRSELIGLLDVAREQEMLEAEARAAAERFGSAPAFKAAIEGAADEMHRAARNLRERNTGEATQRAEQTAVRRYQQLVSALKPLSKSGAGRQGGQSGGAGGGGGSGGQRDNNALTELVLIKLMQEEIVTRTKELDEARRRKPLTPDEQAEFQRLGRDQGKLADLLIDIAGTAGSESPEPELDLKLDEPEKK
jgi:hypothetical protein